VTVTVVGIDVLFRVQSRDLMSLKLEQGRVTVDQRAVTRVSGEPRPFRLVVLHAARPIPASRHQQCVGVVACAALLGKMVRDAALSACPPACSCLAAWLQAHATSGCTLE
jgi:hypothetical protein